MNKSKSIKACVSEFARLGWHWDLDTWPIIMKEIGFSERGSDSYWFKYLGSDGILFFAANKEDYISQFTTVLENSDDDQDSSPDNEGNDEIVQMLIEHKIEAALKVWSEYLDDIREAIGQPYFAGVMGDPNCEDYPDDVDALALAYWNLKNACLSLTLDNTYPEDPCVIHLVVSPID